MTAAVLFLAVPAALLAYAYLGYPLLLAAAARRGRVPLVRAEPTEWPTVTVLVVAYNAERAIARTLDHLLDTDYPPERRRIVVVSDASTDGTDEIVRAYAGRGVTLLRQPSRAGKTAAENAATAALWGEIVVYTDATIVVPRPTLKRLLRPFEDRGIGVVSGRDVSVVGAGADSGRGERAYSGYEMWVRSLEGRFGTIVGATGSLYAARRVLHDPQLSPEVTRDFASALAAYEGGWRAVSADDAVALVSRAPSLAAEFRRKARTMVLGVDALWHFRRLMNPLRHGAFALMLLSHKLCRWLGVLTMPIGLVGLALLSAAWHPALIALTAAVVVVVVGGVALALPEDRSLPAGMLACGYVVVTVAAALVAWGRVARGQHSIVWEPTRRATERVDAAPAEPAEG